MYAPHARLVEASVGTHPCNQSTSTFITTTTNRKYLELDISQPTTPLRLPFLFQDFLGGCFFPFLFHAVPFNDRQLHSPCNPDPIR